MEDGYRHFGRDEKELIKTYKNISENKLRMWLIRSLISKNLATRDIYTFAQNQSELRSVVKSLDRKTMDSAMRMKLKDIKLVLSKYIYKKKFQEMKIKENYGTESLKACKNKLRGVINEEMKKRKKYEAKIHHYKRCQTEYNKKVLPKKISIPTTAPIYIFQILTDCQFLDQNAISQSQHCRQDHVYVIKV